MRATQKLARELEEKAVEFEASADVFGELSVHLEAKQLAHLSGKLLYKAGKETDVRKSDQIKRAAELILVASDLLKRI
jgi:hypothetical protein